MKSICLLNTSLNSNKNFRGSIKALQPIELLYIYEIFKKNYKVDIFDMAFYSKMPLEIETTDLFIISSSPNYLFWRCPPLNFDFLWQTIFSIKSINKHANILLIGPHGQLAREIFFDQGVDYILIGEPELVIESYVDNIFWGKASNYIYAPDCDMDKLPF
ncbi:MAG: hypothetical protein ABF289_16010, partial [Clostridiales bacterium]